MIHIHWILDLHQKGEKITLRKPVLERILVKTFQPKHLRLANIFQKETTEKTFICHSEVFRDVRTLRCMWWKQICKNSTMKQSYLMREPPDDSHKVASLVAQMVKNLPAMPEMWVQSMGWEDPLEKGTATHSSNLARRIPWTEEPGGL